MKSRVSRIAAAVAVVLALAGCRTTIRQILSEPQKYANQDVTVGGDVVKSFSLLGHGAFKIDDGTGTMWIVSTQGVPRQGGRVAVKGRVKDVADISSVVPLPPDVAREIGSGLVMLSSEQRAQ